MNDNDLIVDGKPAKLNYEDIFVFGYLGSAVNHLRWLVLMADSFSFMGNYTANQKLDFIENKVYFSNRNYKNWIRVEREYKNSLRDSIVKFDHNVWTSDKYKKIFNNKSIFMDTDPLQCLRYYFVLETQLNGISNKDFLHSVHLNRITIKKELKNLLVIDGNFLNRRKLCESVTKNIEDFLEVSIPYVQTSKVHELWYDLKTKAESEFLHDVRTIFKER